MQSHKLLTLSMPSQLFFMFLYFVNFNLSYQMVLYPVKQYTVMLHHQNNNNYHNNDDDDDVIGIISYKIEYK